LTPEYSDTKEIEIEDPNAERVKAEREAFIAKLNKPVIIQAIPPAATGTGSGSAQLIIPKSGQFGRIAGAAVALVLTVAAGAYALLSHVQGPSAILPVVAQADDPLKLEAAHKAATNPTANAATGVGETAKPPLELDEPPQTGAAPVQVAKSSAPAATATARGEAPAIAPVVEGTHATNPTTAKGANETKAWASRNAAANAHHQPPGHRPLPTLTALPTLPAQHGKKPAAASSGATSAPASGATLASVAASTPKPAAVAPPSTGATSAPAAPAATGPGMLVVATSPWCHVIVDGTDRGATPTEIKLPAGVHSVLLTNPEFHINRQMSIDIKPGITIRKRFDFAD
jgi:hypothetical protein